MLLRLATRVVRPIALSAAGCAAVWLAWSFATQRVAGRIGESARRGEIPATAATQALHAMHDAAVATLAGLAVDANPQVAQPARVALGARVDEWRRDAKRDAGRFARRLERLLAALDQPTVPLTHSAKDWASRFTLGLLPDVSQTPARRRTALLAKIDAVVDTIAEAPVIAEPPVVAVQEPSEPEPIEAIVGTSEPSNELRPPTDPLAVARPLPPPPTRKVPPVEDAQQWTADWAAPPEPRPLVAEPTRPLAPAPREVAEEPRPLESAGPSDRELLAALLAATDRRATTPVATGPRSARRRAAELDPETREISRSLYERGYRGVSLDHVRALLSDDPRDRVRLVERLLVDKTGDTAKLLLLLAYDDDAVVRAAALTALAASPRRELVEASWEIALRDPDPRVGRLADSIGERLR